MLLSLTLASTPALATEPPTRIQDLQYGPILFDYYQGNAFEALSGLAVARARGGIQGHGLDPLLVEGGLMLSYGMTREAKQLFEQVLADNAAPDKRNQAWFYLGKLFYLEQDYDAAVDALEKIDGERLAEQSPELHQEWLYLRGQLALTQHWSNLEPILDALPADSLWRAYLHYNQAIGQVEQAPDQARDTLTRLIADLNSHQDQNEAKALRERALLTLGQLHLQQGRFESAQAALKQIRLDSPFSDEALVHYAVAATQAKDYGLALQALNTLHNRPLFTPWLQQVPYARGYVHEQLGDLQQALRVYRDAGGHYEHLIQTLINEREQLTEARLMAALQFEGVDSLAEPTSPKQPAITAEVRLGDERVGRDPYGRVQVQPADFSLAALLATEPFQLGLRDLHELYRLSEFLHKWERQLSSFELMLETRAQQRSLRIEQTQAALATQQADQWQAQQAAFNAQIDKALAEEDAVFFMTAEQKDQQRQIDRLFETLALLPNDEKTAAQREKAQRIKAYFDWLVADQYAVNRWAAQKQLREANQAMNAFQQKTQDLQQEMASDGENARLAERVRQNQAALSARRQELEQTLGAARQAILEQVREELTRQETEVRRYLRAARQAQARLADALLQAPPAQKPESPAPATGGQP